MKNNKVEICAKEGCKLTGEYKAPLNKSQLRSYQFFCLEHIKEFNKSWNFHEGYESDFLEEEIKKDTIWRRFTKPFGSSFRNFNDEIFQDTHNFFKKNNSNLTGLRKHLNNLELEAPVTLEKVKKQYKKLVKIYHPDIREKNQKENVEKFRNIVSSYNYLLNYFSR